MPVMETREWEDSPSPLSTVPLPPATHLSMHDVYEAIVK